MKAERGAAADGGRDPGFRESKALGAAAAAELAVRGREVVVSNRGAFPRTVGLDAFPPDEVRALRELVESLPKVDHRIMQIIQRSPDKLEILTGAVLAPLCGSGSIIYVRKENGHWVADQDSVGMWVA